MGDRFYMEMNSRQYKALQKSLTELKGPRVNAINRTASTKAIRPVRLDVKRRVRPISKTISKAVDYVVRTYKKTGTVVALVGTDKRKLSNAEGQQYPSNILDLIEMGTEPHKIKTNAGIRVLTNYSDMGDENIEVFGREVDHPGSPAHPVLRPSFSANRSKMEATWASEMGAGVIKEFNKANKK